MNQSTRSDLSSQRRWLILIVTALVGICLTIGLSGCEPSENENSTVDPNMDSALNENTVEDENREQDNVKVHDLAIGDSATIDGVTITVDSIQDTRETAAGDPTIDVQVSYRNESGQSIDTTPRNWTVVLADGSEKAHLDEIDSFDTQNLTNGEEKTETVTFYFDEGEEPESIKFDSSMLSNNDNTNEITWTIA